LERKAIWGMVLTLLIITMLPMAFNIHPVRAPLVTDLNGDGKVDGKDIAVVGLAFGSYPGHERWNPAADINHDDRIDGMDLSMVARDFGKTDP